MSRSREDWQRKRASDGEAIDRDYAALCESLDGAALPLERVDDVIALATRIDSHLHDMASTKQDDSPDAVRRDAGMRHLLELTEEHLPERFRAQLASRRNMDRQLEQQRHRRKGRRIWGTRRR